MLTKRKKTLNDRRQAPTNSPTRSGVAPLRAGRFSHCSRAAFVGSALVVAPLLTSCSNEPEAKIPTPKLVLFIVVDQFPQEYFKRFNHLFTGGFARLQQSGVVFEEAQFGHANTYTCPGHASLATGSHPSTHGIIENRWFDRGALRSVSCTADRRYGIAPTQLRVTALPDWLLERYPRAKVFSVSAKDRAAVMLGGHSARAAYWFDPDVGMFRSSRYYAADGEWWLENFNKTSPLTSYFGTLWHPLPLTAEDLAKAQIFDVDKGAFARRFPHALGGPRVMPTSDHWRSLASSPFIDHLSSLFARHLIKAERLGDDAAPDYLAISFSAPDRVGHKFGPHSREVLDTLLRLDQTLAELFEFIDQEIGLEHVLLAFSADHGVQSLPEHQQQQGIAAHRMNDKDIACVQQIVRKSSKKIPVPFITDFYLDHAKLSALGLQRRDVDKAVEQAILDCRLVERVWSSDHLAAVDPSALAPTAAELPFVRSYDPERSPDYLLQFKENHLPRPRHGTSHGTHHRYDAHVPMILVHPSLPPQAITRPAQPIDLAVTIADLVGATAPKTADGRSWAEALLP